MTPCWTLVSRLALARSVALAGVVALIMLGATPRLDAAEPDATDAQRELLAGNYAFVIEHGAKALRENPAGVDWALLVAQAQLASGKNIEAQHTIEEAMVREPTSIRLRWLGREVAFANGRPEEAASLLQEIRRLVTSRQWLYRTPVDLVVIGRAFILLGYDPKEVLDKLFATAQKAEPKLRDVYLARGELALDKHDFALAARAFDEGLKQLPDDPDLLYGRARAYADTRTEAENIALTALTQAVKLNPRHAPSLVLLAANRIDSEEYAEAAKLLDQVIAVNPTHPDAWAYRAVLAHLRHDDDAEAAARAEALRTWATNPRVDFLIGEKLAQKYRFAEAAAYQRRAIEFDPGYLPATAQLATDLLRLGDEDEGWRLAQAVHDRDDYDVEAFNLVTLRDTMAKYATLKSDDLVVRMAANEVTIYGPRVLALLRRAKSTLTAKYGVELASPTYVEVFADQKDFAVRTFGMPDVPGFLGVCFGRVVTANGPAATGGHPVNWESVLWHEFCHAVTLQLTRNRMPRWLSEGISVYEERQADPAWGMRLNARYAEMIAKGELTPVGSLSAAFLSPKSADYLQFAYLESSLVVEFIVTRYGLDHLRGVLGDLRDGREINAALAKNVAPIEQFEKDFAAFAHERAARLAPGLDWTRLPKDAVDMVSVAVTGEKAGKKTDNYWALSLQAQQLMEAKKWTEARALLTTIAALNPAEKGADTPYRPLVAVLRELGDTEAERATLTKWAAIDDEAPEAYLRLMELGAAASDWPAVRLNAERFLRVNPLVAPPWRYLAQASTAAHDAPTAINALRILLQLEPADPAAVHFQLAQLLHQTGANDDARRHTLLALEEAPRYREALKLLLELRGADAPPGSPKT